MFRILIADDHDLLRHQMRTILTASGLCEICGEATNGKEAVEQVRTLHPELVILDYLMPKMNGFEAARQIRSIAPSTRIIMLSVFDAHQMKGAAQLAGIDAFVSKSAVTLDLLAAVNRVLAAEDHPLRSRNCL